MESEGHDLLHNSLKRLMDEYRDVYSNVLSKNDWQNSFRDIITKDIPKQLQTRLALDDNYKITGSYGKGRWTTVPWIAVFDKRITDSAQKGVYIVYLLNKDTKTLYLVLEVAATETISDEDKLDGKTGFTGMTGNQKEEKLTLLRDRAATIRTKIQNDYFKADNGIKTNSSAYDSGTVYYKKYEINTLPGDDGIIDDLKRMLALYEKYRISIHTKQNAAGNDASEKKNDQDLEVKESDPWFPPMSEYDPGFTKDDWLKVLNNPKIIGPVYGNLLAMFYTEPKGISCKALGKKFGQGHDSIAGTVTNLARTIYKQTGCNLFTTEDGKACYWYILFQSKDSENPDDGNSIYRLRPELYEALSDFDILKYLKGVEGEMQITFKEAIEKVKAYIAANGFTYSKGMIENFYLSLKSKPFVILAGISGTGKTKLVELFAKAINAEYRPVAVRPDWSDSSDLFGHLDLKGKFVPGEVLRIIVEASKNLDKPYILCLDEMNLARVEYYLSDYLSVIEMRKLNDNIITTVPIMKKERYGNDKNAKEEFGEVCIPQNLYLVGTVNMDETTFPFSKKVLDRANTIEFSDVNLIPDFADGEKAEGLKLGNVFLKTEYLFLKQCEKDQEYVNDVCGRLQKINEILRTANAHVGYRVRDEIVFYMMINKETKLLSEDEAFDNEIMQKILPRIQGSSVSVKEMLCELFKELNGDFEGMQTINNNIADLMMKKLNDSTKYRKSSEKIAFMVRRFEEDGFTSYWL